MLRPRLRSMSMLFLPIALSVGVSQTPPVSEDWVPVMVRRLAVLPDEDRGLRINEINVEGAGAATALSQLDAASLHEIVESAVEDTESFRLVVPASEQVADVDAFLMMSVARISAGWRVSLRALDPDSRVSLVSVSVRGQDVRAACYGALVELEAGFLRRAWRTRVAGVTNSRILIRRGRTDGLREGMQLEGRQSGSTELPDDLAALATSAAGSYRVVELRDEVAALEPVDGAPLLAVNDLLELPEIPRVADPAKSRNSRVIRDSFDSR